MPGQKKAKWAQLRVGVMAVFALVILGVLIFLLTGTSNPFAEKSVVYTFLSDSAALGENAAVRLNGIHVGKVTHIALSGSKDPNRVVRMDLEIEDKYLPAIPVDSVASIGAENILGTKYINITKGQSSVTVKAGQEIPSKNISDITDFLDQGSNLLVQLQGILKRVDVIVGTVEAGKGSIGKLLTDEQLYNNLNAVTMEAQHLVSALNTNKGTIGKLVNSDELYNDMRSSIARLDGLIDGLQQGQGTAGKLLKDPALYDDAHRTIVELRNILADLNAGKGTAGKLLKSEELSNRILGTINRVDSILDKVNSGQGTIGQLLVNASLYDNLNGTTRELQGLLKDFRANPKKYLSIKLGFF
jgi:phospholipid/cholesterol/gamma-HCH transport system substrate-binding protein